MPKGIFERTDAHKRNISKALKGRIKSDNERAHISEGKLGKPQGEETKALKSALFSGENNPFFGKVHSEESKHAISDRKRGRTALLQKYGISEDDYAAQIALGNGWCCFGKHFAAKAKFVSKNNVCETCKSDFYRRQDLKRKYGVTPKWYDETLASQGGLCAICRSTRVSLGDKNMAVDHDHETGNARGILCMACNTLLGRLEDRGGHNWFYEALAYLTRHK